jgi:hypothetical protein
MVFRKDQYNKRMIGFPISELLDEQASERWLEKQLHLKGLACPRCGSNGE